MRYLGFDFGDRRIGVAIGDSITGQARPLKVIGRDWAEIDALVAEWQPDGIVVGLPLDEDGGEQAMTARARRFARGLHQRAGRPVYTCDERYSSLAADSALRDAGGRPPASNDALAASIILEQWLSQTPPAASTTPSPPPA